MNTKLTLRLDKEIIEKAKEYASERKVSLSKIVERYLQSITADQDSTEFGITPFVKSISTGNWIPVDLDYKKEYSDYVKNKYK